MLVIYLVIALHRKHPIPARPKEEPKEKPEEEPKKESKEKPKAVVVPPAPKPEKTQTKQAVPLWIMLWFAGVRGPLRV